MYQEDPKYTMYVPETKKLSWLYSSPMIIASFIFFWPLSLFLIYKRSTADKTAVLKRSKTLGKIAWFLLIGLIFFIIVYFSEGMQTTEGEEVGWVILLFPVLFFGGGAAALFYLSKTTKASGLRYKKYIELIVNRSQSSIDAIASAAGVSYEMAYEDLQKMIDYGFFRDAFIDEGQREIILPHHISRQATAKASPAESQNKTKVVACSSCGANNTVYAGQSTECEYCGTPLAS